MPPTARTLLSKHLILHLHRLGRCRGKLWNLASWRIVQSISILQKLISSVQRQLFITQESIPFLKSKHIELSRHSEMD